VNSTDPTCTSDSKFEEFQTVNETENMANNMPHVFNLSNSIIGVYILAMPFCFKEVITQK